MLSRRLFSTSARQLKTQATKLANGVFVATKANNSGASTIGVYLGSGSRSENPYNSGVSTLVGSVLAGSSAAKQSLTSGVEFSSSNAKETTGLIKANFANGNTKAGLQSVKSLIGSIDSIISDNSYVKEKAAEAAYFAEVFEATPSKMVVEHTISTAFQGTSLALPTYGKPDTVGTLETGDLTAFLKKQFVASNIAIVGSGDVSHDELVKFASELTLTNGVKPAVEPAHFLGSEARHRDDTLPQAHVAIAVKAPSVRSPDYITGLVAAAINGHTASHKSPFTQYEGSQLSQTLHENHLLDSFNHFNLGYTDAGLWGAYLETSNIACLDETVHFTLKDWNRYSTGTVSETELVRAKQQLKLALFSSKTSSEAADAVAFDALVKGYSQSSDELAQAIDAVTLSSLKTWAQTYLYDQDIAMSGTGQIEALFDYNRIRNDMSLIRW
ncbi:unnamed protein product [Ambrosiozyma monospora]|uniref:Unnamed protein product n=1 Tax=Ambrosiozyma monospora TaxID=43982 RepID=A0A9W7DEE2_AMBMO|nr:unnamed protein product [Ambrosiozyma monospora]